MAYKITEYCIRCGVCAAECPGQAISKGEKYFVIDRVRCDECIGNGASPKCVEICPVKACIPDADHVENKDQLLKKWRK
jgi:ferredoxin